MNKISKVCIFFSLTILIISFIIYSEFEFGFSIVELDPTKFSNAVCLDGSNYRFQMKNGTSTGNTSFLIYFEPGGFCGDDKKETYLSCMLRKNNFLGSNKFTILDRFFISRFSRLMSSKSKYNKNFYNWNKIFIRYCDSALYKGSQTVYDKIIIRSIFMEKILLKELLII